jgi:hypothetical protein
VSVLLLLFGAPALVTMALVTANFRGEVTRGAQPGGPIAGSVVDADDEPLRDFELELATVASDGQSREVARTRTDADGRFAFQAPACEGHYELRAGGGTWQRAVHGVSFLDREGRTIEPRPITLAVEPGCQLELTFARGDKRAVGDGEYTLEGDFGTGYLFGLVKARMRSAGKVHAGVLRVDGLPPMRAELSVRFESGETVELELQLAPGVQRETVAL